MSITGKVTMYSHKIRDVYILWLNVLQNKLIEIINSELDA